MSSYSRIIVSSTIILAISACTSLSSNAHKQEPSQIAQINTRLGIAYLQKHDMARAKQKLLSAMHEAPDTPEPWYSMAYFYEVTGDEELAKKHYLKALELAPQRGDVQNNYGTYLCRLGNYQQGIKHFLMATKDVDYLEAASAYENAGLCALKIPDPVNAKKYFELAIAQDPSMQSSQFEAAKLNYKAGDYAKAQRELDAFLLLSPPSYETNALQKSISLKLTS